MVGKIDFIIPIHRGEIEQPERIKRRFDFIESLNDIDGMTYTILGTYSSPQITVDEIRKIIPSRFFRIEIIANEETESIASEYNFKIKEHYYPITSVTWEWIIRNKSLFENGEAFHIFHINDMYPFALNWAQQIFKAWTGVARPFIFGEWWHGGVNGPGPFIDGLYNWKWSTIHRKWGGWGAYDAELPYIAWNNNLSVVPSLNTVGILTHNFLRRMKKPIIDTENLAWIDETFNTWLSIFHNFEDKWYYKDRWENDTVFNYLVNVYNKKKIITP